MKVPNLKASLGKDKETVNPVHGPMSTGSS